MFARIIQWIKELLNKMINTSNVKDALRVDVALSTPMVDALRTWSDMYKNESSWLTKDVYSLNLAAAIAGEIARSVTIEMAVKISGSARADYLSQQMEKVLPRLRTVIEYGCAKGGLMFKPYVAGKEIFVDYVQADQFFPVAFDANGNIKSCVFMDQRVVGATYYTRLEYHNLTENGYIVKNSVYKSSSKDSLGQEAPFSDIEDWKNLLPEATITGIKNPLFAYFKYPLANNIDPASPLGVSCYSRAVDLIEQADLQWSNLLWEFESGQRALYADVVAFDKTDDGKPILPQKRLYRALNGGSNIGDNPEGLFHEWTPTLREQNYLNGLDSILKKIEFLCGIAYGTISDPQTVDKTATEITTSKQRTYSTISDTQKSLKQALEQLLYAMDTWATLSRLAPKGKYTAKFDFDDSIIVDKDAQFQQDLRLVTAGIMSKIEFRMRNFGEDEAAAKAALVMQTEEQPKETIEEGV
jgi:A118 family predicted phage portal protein